MSEQQDPGPDRSAFLTVLLAGIASFFFLLMLILLTGGFFFYVVLVFGLAGSLAAFHWLLWGKLLTQMTAGRRQEEELLNRARAEEESGRRLYRR